ncbi:MAG: Dam family site-specific DNA-(adenine-N6)-methyltransferase [Oscillospiraceae bacterium]
MDSFIGWIGGKKLLRSTIIERFPKELPTSYVEVFGGAGWVFFAKEKTPKQLEVFNDADSNLINLFRCIKYHREAVLQELEFLLSARETFYDFREQMAVQGLTDIQRAARYFYLIKVSFGCDRRSFGTNKKRIDKTMERLSEIQERLVGVVVENKDFEALINLYDKAGALFYLDPPYHGTEKHYDGKFTLQDHYRLRDCLKKIKGKFILSYNDDEFIRELYAGFNIEGVLRNSTLAAHSASGDKFAEVIITNY